MLADYYTVQSIKYIRIFILTLFILNYSNNLLAESPPFKLKGNISIIRGNLADVKVDIYKNGNKIKTLTPNSLGKYEYELEYQNEYKLTFSKPGFVEKSMIIDTHLPPEQLDKDFKYKWDTDVKLFKQYDGINFTIFTQPVQKIFYDEKSKKFDFDSDYNKMILSDLQKISDQVDAAVATEIKQEEDAAKEEERLAKEAEEKKTAAEAAKKEAEKEQQKAEEEARKKAEEENRKKAEAEAALKAAEEEAKRKAADEARKLADAAYAKKRAEEEAQEKAEEEARKKAEAEARKKQLQEEAMQKEEQRLLDEANKKLREEERKKKLEEERIAAEERLQAEAENRKRMAESKARQAEEDKKRLQAEAAEREAKRREAALAAKEEKERQRLELQKQQELAWKNANQPRYISEEALRYPVGKNVETFEDSYRITTRIIISDGKIAHIYKKVHHRWGPTFFFKEGQSVSYPLFYKETGEL